ncbi:unnamed protein product, partial [Ectocarpus sp. 12 AP-2014]
FRTKFGRSQDTTAGCTGRQSPPRCTQQRRQDNTSPARGGDTGADARMTAAPATKVPLNAAAAAATQQDGAGVFQVDNVDSEVEQPAAPKAAAPAPAVTAREALRHSFTVGLSGGGATIFSVATMMWLHTIITYQQRHGTKFGETCKILWRQGGPRRFYRGVLPSLASAPLCRFGDTLSNELA